MEHINLTAEVDESPMETNSESNKSERSSNPCPNDGVLRSNGCAHSSSSSKECAKVAIIGLGARGLNVLERLSAIYDPNKHDYELDVYLFDPGSSPGQGVHSSEQNSYLLINTVACQVTMFGDESVTDYGPLRKGPGFFDWAKQQGYRRMPNNQYLITTDETG
ncbi:unnamed protein product, partial [Didymodactylos carnosus]